MRYGVKDENTLAHQTWIACSNEIERCRLESSGIVFVSLQGNKYGYTPLPYSILASSLTARLNDAAKLVEAVEEIEKLKFCDLKKYEKIQAVITNVDLAAYVKTWYILDENAEPHRYFLRHLTSMSDSSYWDVALPVLIEVLRGVEFEQHGIGSQKEPFVVGQSVTEWEVKSAFLVNSGNEDLTRIHWLHRYFTTPMTKSDFKYENFDDTINDGKKKEGLANLLSWMELSVIQTASYPQSSYHDFIHWRSHLDKWQADLTQRLRDSLENIIIRKDKWEGDGDDLGLPGKVLTEMLHHYKWAELKNRTFFGRKHLIDEIIQKIYYPLIDENDSDFGGVCLALIGGSGCGKTSIMAKVASLVFENEESAGRRPIIIRFCGTSPGSFHGHQLVLSMCLQISFLFDLDPSSLEKLSYEEIVKVFHVLVNDHALIIFIDSLDQLSNNNLARSHLSFLKGVKPHRDTRIIVSALPDDRLGSCYFYGCETKLLSGKVAIQRVMNFEQDGGGIEMMNHLMQAKGRQLTQSQTEIIKTQISVEPTALYILLASEIVLDWRSTMVATVKDLPGGVHGLLEFLFDKISVDYGKCLTKFSFGFLTYSLEGISDGEMCDLLSLSEEVMTEISQYNSTSRVPIHVWLRLRSSIESVLTEQSGGCVKWYHRQLKEFAEKWAADKKFICHEIMGRYFGNIVPQDILIEKSISTQPLVLDDSSNPSTVIFCDISVLNNRRFQEAAHHLLLANMGLEAQTELCSIPAVTGRARIGIIFQYLGELGQLQTILPGSPVAKHYCRWLMRDAHLLSRNPTALGSCTTQPLESLVREHFFSFRRNLNNCLIGTYGSVSFGRVLGGSKSFDKDLNVLQGHAGEVTAVAFSPDMKLVVSASDDKTIRIWDSFTGQLLNLLEGHDDYVTSVSFNYDGSRIVSGSDDKTIRIWDSSSGDQINELKGHDSRVWSVSFNYDGSRIVSGSLDRTIRIWDSSSGDQINELKGHDSYVFSVSFNYDGSRIVSGSNDKTIRIWDSSSGDQINELKGHDDSVSSVSFNYDGSRIVSGSYDNTIRIWDSSSGDQINELKGHDSRVWSVSFNYDGSRIVSGSLDRTI
eukprot:gene15326-20654_t